MTVATELALVQQVNALGNRMVELEFRAQRMAADPSMVEYAQELESEREVVATKRYVVQRKLWQQRKATSQ